MISAAEQHLRQYAGRCLLDGNPSDLVLKIPSALISIIPHQGLRDTLDLFTVDYAKHQSIDGGRILRELANGGTEGLAALFAELVGQEDIPPMPDIEKRIGEGIAKFTRATTRPHLFESIAAMLATPLKPVWLVKRLVETPSTNLIFGPSGGGKSFVAVDLGSAVATGGTWMGRAVTPGPVFYLAGEGRIGLLRRFTAWQLQRKVQIPPDRLFLSTARIELNQVGAAAVEQEVARRAEAIGERPALIVIDTLARALPAGDDENAAKDMGKFVNIVDQLRDRFQCAAFIVHHAGVADDKRARGSTSLKAAMDTELCITDHNGARTAEWTKLKDLPKAPNPEGFALERVLLGADDDGEIITSAAVTWQGRTALKTTTSTTKAENLGLETLRATITAGAGPASVEAWRFVFYSRHWGEDNAAKRKAFARVRESLAGKGLIRIDDGNYSIPIREGAGA